MKLLWIDTETGGLDPTVHSLLSLGLVVTEPSGGQASTEILFRHPVYTVDADALAVNRIDLVRHHAKACEPAHAASLMAAFIGRHFSGEEEIQLAGHNVAFDIAFLGRFLRQHAPTIYARFSHRMMDTMVLATALQHAGVLPRHNMGLSSLLAHYGIQLPDALRHTALGDASATERLYHRMIADFRLAGV